MRASKISESKNKLLIFDLDGVLINITPNSFPSTLLWGLTGDDLFEKEISFKSTNWIDEFKSKGIDTDDRMILQEISRRMFEHNRPKIKLFPWVFRQIPILAKKYTLAILTNNSRETVSWALGSLEAYFSSIKTWQNVPELKPGPGGIHLICRELKIPRSETLLVGDSEEDFLAAERAGITAKIVRSGYKQPVF